jgi:hypothetical protein
VALLQFSALIIKKANWFSPRKKVKLQIGFYNDFGLMEAKINVSLLLILKRGFFFFCTTK